jgi:hypothetical protein
MTPAEINKAIAESRRWMAHPTVRNVWRTPEQCERNKKLIGTVSGPWSTESSGPPNYYNDLNSIQEAVMLLTPDQMIDYCNFRLRAVVGEGCITDYKMINATAPQRCEAYLRTIGKWRDQ